MNSNDPLKQALELQHAGNIDEALSVCLSLAEQQPGDFRIHFLLGMLYQQLDKAESAIHHFTEATRLHPELPSAFYNLGVLFFSKGNMEQAVEAYTKAGHLNPDDPDIFYNLALSQKKLGLVKEARKNYEKVLSLNPADTDALYNLGVLCRETGKTEEAIRYFEKVITIDPTYISGHNNLAYLFHKQGNREQALASYQQVLALDPSRESARHMAAALSGKTTDSSPLSYVKELFDQFSDDFDESLLEKLYYSTPQQLRELLESWEDKQKYFANGLDMGCGTGLSGLAFAERVKSFTGLDLSAGMLEKAGEKKIYTVLKESDIVSFLSSTTESFDLFVAADVFVYLGDLTEIFTRVKERALPGAFFLFSTEICAENFCLQPSGRYGHAEDYIRQLADTSGFTVECCRNARLRKERDAWIMGNLFLLCAKN